jgi:enamine deaminase RidA (YjgF/YER057c/UK114 family)
MARREQVISVYPELEARYDEQFRLIGADDMALQIRTIYARMQFVLAKANATLEHVVRETNFTTNSPALSEAAHVRQAIYEAAGAAMPAATAVHVDSLVLAGAMLEIHATAVLD